MKVLNDLRRALAVWVLIVVYLLTPKKDFGTLKCIFDAADAMSKSHEDWS